MHSRSSSSSSDSSSSSRSSSSRSSSSLGEMNEVDVVVIGGGCAGLECAEKLYSYGFKNVIVLEAQDYLGGRAKTIYLDDDECYPLEMGANWIHGLWGSPFYKLIKENPSLFQHKKKKLFADEFIYCADEMGRVYDSSMCQQFYALYKAWNAEAKLLWIQEKKSSFQNYTDFMLNKLKSYIENDTKEMKQLKTAILMRCLKAETVECACSTMDMLSVDEYGSYDRPNGPDFEFPGGFSKLIEFLASKLPKNAVKLNHPVKFIDMYDANSMLIECHNGAVFKSRHVVVTCSVNYLKKNYSSLFSSILLSEKKIDAIKSSEMGTVDKVFMFYDDMSFLPAQVDSIHPIYLNEKNGDMRKNWYYKTFAFDRFYENLLLVWISGEEANFVENLPEEEIADTMTEILRKLFSNPNIPKPKKILKTMWNSNPYILGSYSYIGINGSAHKHITNLAEPIYINQTPRVLFAGEATHLRYYSTMHGAYLSGQREAKRLNDFYHKEK